ncbi:MAG: tripartite tricarboxylate transporter substrate binding protein, partial [Roseomonas sp.]|nr:tripartite tricarboxylate transporter substrate binding protein [Roseomonas sp.]
MRITRRAAIAGALLPFAARAQAPEWPSRPVRFIVPYPPGGPTDIMGRIVAQAVQGPLGQPFVVENRAGANGLIGSEQAARAAPDGSTFLVNASAHVIVPHLTPNMPIDVLADFAPVTNIAAVPLWLVVNPALPVRSVAEFIAYARANPGKIAY